MRNEEIEMLIKYFKITTYMKDGEVWETIRHTKEGMEIVLSAIIKDEEVDRFSVEEYN